MTTAAAEKIVSAAHLRRIAEDPAALGGVAAHFGLAPDEEGLRALAARFRVPRWVQGEVAFADAWFLTEMVRCLRPERMVEIGVASGVSSAVLLAALRECGGRLESFDLLDRCYFDPSRAVGEAVGEMAPELAGSWRLRTGLTAIDVGRELAGADLPLAFIDADHQHPWPVVDLLALRPVLRPGAWVILHDIALPRCADQVEQTTGTKVPWRHRGVELLFEAWPHEKLRGQGASYNIGAVRMPESGGVSLSDFERVLDLPWEVEPGVAARELLGRPFEVDEGMGAAAGWVAERARAGERVALYGMGTNARRLLNVLRRRGERIELSWLDDRPEAEPPPAEGLTLRRVRDVGELEEGTIVVVTPNETGAIESALRRRGVSRVVRARELG